MNPKVEIHSLSISKSKSEQTAFNKYDIEAALEEVGSTDTETKVKYTFMLLSNPRHTRISVEGISSITGSQSEIAHYLSQDENNIPRIASTIYQELFPLFYVISKSMQIPCPAFKLSHISAPSQSEVSTQPTQVADTLQPQSVMNKTDVEPTVYSEQTTAQVEKTPEQEENVVEEPTVRQA